MKNTLTLGLVMGLLGYNQVCALTAEYNEVAIETKAKDGAESAVIRGISYTYDQSSGILTGVYADVSFDLTLGWELSEPTSLIYVENNSGVDWGFGVTGTNQMTQRWKDKYDSSSGWDGHSIIAAETILSGVSTGATSAKYTTTLTGEGTFLKHYGSTTWDVYSNGGLKTTSGTLSKITVNTDYITNLYVKDVASYKNSDSSWSMDAKGTNCIDSNTTINGGKESDIIKSQGAVVVGGKGKIFLQEWGQSNVVINNDFYIGTTSQGEAIHFGSDDNGKTTTLNGNIYLVENAKIKSRGTDTINITGVVTDKNVPGSTKTDGGYTLSIAGQGYVFKNSVNVSTIEFEATQKIHTYTDRTTNAHFEQGFITTQLIMNGGNVISSDVELALTNIQVNNNATLSADLTLDGGLLNMAGSLKLGNHSLTLGVMELSGSKLEALIAAGDGFVTLFENVSSVSLIGDSSRSIYDFSQGVEAEKVFTNLEAGKYSLVHTGGNVRLEVIPEPTTATLSLLALAGLAARRRRR